MAQLWPLLFRSRAPRAEAATTDLITRGPALRGLRKSRSWTQSSDGASAREEQERRRRCELFGPDTERIDAAAIQRVPMSDKRIVRTRTLMRNRPDTMRGAGIIVSTLKALVREGHADGVVYVVALESQPRANVSRGCGRGSTGRCMLRLTHAGHTLAGPRTRRCRFVS